VILDSSAVIAMLLREPGWEALTERVSQSPQPAIGAATLAETGAVSTARLGITGQTLLERFLVEANLSVIPFTAEHARTAVDAFQRSGRGRHPAALNFGDCLTYATALVAAEPLLCVGNDFPQTDLEVVSLDDT
jgi:ribonuclease VapC